MEEKDYRINEEIKAKEVRVIGPDGKQIGIMSVKEALEEAEKYGLDLVEVAPNSNPPVCKIVDYGKFMYELKKKRKEAMKKQHRVSIKEMKFRPKTEEHDLQFKIKHIKNFLSEGNKVKVNIFFKGRELAHREIAEPVIKRIVQEVSEIAKVEKEPEFDGRRIVFLIAPKKSTKEQGG